MAVTFNTTELQALLQDVGACGEIGTQLGETLYTKAFVEGDVANTYDVETGVNCGGYILTDKAQNEYDALVQVESCELPGKDLSLSFGAEKWNPIDIGRRFSICYKDIEKGVRKILGDPRCENTPYMPDAVLMYFEEKIAEMTNNNIFARIWLGETAATQPWLAGFDGFLIQLQAKLAAANKITITENAGSTAITPTAAYNYLTQLYWRAVELGVDDLKDVQIYASRDIVNGYFQHVVNEKMTNAFNQVDGMSPVYDKNNLGMFGIPVKTIGFTGAAAAASKNADSIALLAPKANLKIGTCNEGSFKNVKVWFDQKDRVQNFDVEEISLDAKAVAPSQIIMAY